MRHPLNLLFALALAGCSGKVIFYDKLTDACTGEFCEGIPFYRLVPEPSFYIHDRILDKNGVMTHYAGGASKTPLCTVTYITEWNMVPQGHQSLIRYEPKPFESSQFSVDLRENGTLAKVGTASTPGTQSATTALNSFVSTVRLATGGSATMTLGQAPTITLPSNPPCTDGKISIEVTDGKAHRTEPPVGKPTPPPPCGDRVTPGCV